jgi:glycine/D-amino acid oxidase-like deaminating enzyme
VVDLRSSRVAVLGAGIVGSAVAYCLASAGARVTLVDRAGPAAATSGNSFAAVSGSTAVDLPAARALWRRALTETRAIATEVGGEWLHIVGAIWWTRDGAPVRLDTDGTPDEMRAVGYRFEMLDEAATRELEPELRLPEGAQVLLLPDEGWIDVVTACRRLVDAATTRHRASLLRGEVREVAHAGSAVVGVGLGDGTRLEADIVVNAAGPWANEIAAMAGSSLVIGRRPGAMVVTSPTRVRLRHVVWGPGMNARPFDSERILVQREPYDRTLTDGLYPTLDHPFAHGAIDDAATILPGLRQARIARVMYGVRPIPPDGEPIIGYDAHVGGLYHAVMHGGVRRASVVARAIARELSGVHVPELEPYRPARFTAAATLA